MKIDFKLTVAIFALCVYAPGDDFIAGYYLEGKCLLLGKSLTGPDGALKPFDSLTPREIATIYHEMWHGWFIERDSPKKGAMFERMNSKAPKIYAAYPQAKRLEIYEEAVAEFIDATIETHVQIKRYLSGKSPERREEIRKTPYLQNTYGRLFSERYNGYYTQDVSALSATTDESPLNGLDVQDANAVLADFIEQAENFGLPTRYLLQGAKSIAGIAFIDLGEKENQPAQASVVFADVYLDKEDIELTAHIIFEGILTESVEDVFCEEGFQ